jgi:hypothetical protein
MIEMTKHRTARIALAVNPQRGPVLKWEMKSGSMLASPGGGRGYSFTLIEVY